MFKSWPDKNRSFPTNCLDEFDHFVRLGLKRVNISVPIILTGFYLMGTSCETCGNFENMRSACKIKTGVQRNVNDL